jgi:hypothetical protein
MTPTNGTETIMNEPATSSATELQVPERGGRPTDDELPLVEAAMYAARSYTTLHRAIADGKLRARKWLGLIFVTKDDLDAIWAPGTLERRKANAKRQAHIDAGGNPAVIDNPPGFKDSPGNHGPGVFTR